MASTDPLCQLPGVSTTRTRSGTGADALPLVVDLDGTLTPTDTLVESILQLLRQRWWLLLLLPLWLAKGRASFKATIARHVRLDASVLPYRTEVLELVRAARSEGRTTVLATAAHISIAASVQEHLSLFSYVLASTDEVNLKGVAKLKTIEKVCPNGFIYAGDSRVDLPIWKESNGAIVVSGSTSLRKSVEDLTPVIAELRSRDRNSLITWLKALRVHQWTKNSLVFVPLLTSFSFSDFGNAWRAVVAFFAFSFAASAMYLVNDLLDLESDRLHPRKRERPLAKGTISAAVAIAVAISLLLLAAMLAAWIGHGLALIILAYVIATSMYSAILKRRVMLDVVVLALLYTVRIVGGAEAISVDLSPWLLAFSLFVFLSLALIKRCSELIALFRAKRLRTRGRDYQYSDLVVLWPFGVGAGLCSIVVLGLFISSDEMKERYGTPELMWFTAIALTYWLGRLWIKTARGEMHDDPLVFAMRDRGSALTIAGMAVCTLAAHFID